MFPDKSARLFQGKVVSKFQEKSVKLCRKELAPWCQDKLANRCQRRNADMCQSKDVDLYQRKSVGKPVKMFFGVRCAKEVKERDSPMEDMEDIADTNNNHCPSFVPSVVLLFF